MERVARAREDGHWHAPVLAGLCLTLAGGFRFEVWALLPLLALPLWRRPVRAAALLACGLLFPAVWLVSCHLATGDFLYSIHGTQHFSGVLAQLKQPVSARMYVIRTAYYPLAIFLGLTPLLALGCLAGAGHALLTRSRRAFWLLPFGMMLAIYVVEAIRGDITTKGRYALLPAVLLLPYLAQLTEMDVIRRRRRGLRRAVALCLVLSLIPLGYAGRLIPSQWPLSWWRGLEHRPERPWRSFYWKNIEPAPRVTETTRRLAETIRQHIEPGDAVLLDFIDWQTSHYLGLASGRHPDRIHIITGARGARPDPHRLRRWIARYPRGLMVIAEPPSRLSSLLNFLPPRTYRLAADGPSIHTRTVTRIEGVRVMRYRVVSR
jgi:hypothetical protein